MKIIHISDLHFPVAVSVSRLGFSKRLIGYLNFVLRRKKLHPIEAAELMVERIRNEQYDLLIVSGDITNVGHDYEFSEARRILSPILNERSFVIPGNHDRYVPDSVYPSDLFFRHFEEFAGTPVPGSIPDYLRTAKIGGITVVGMDSNSPRGMVDASGEISPSALKKYSEYIKSLNEPYILTAHHPVWNPPEKQESIYHKLLNREEFLTEIRKNPPVAYFHGHVHTNWIRKKDSAIPFLISNAASSTRDTDRSHLCGFHILDLQKESFSAERISYSKKQKNLLLKEPVIY